MFLRYTVLKYILCRLCTQIKLYYNMATNGFHLVIKLGRSRTWFLIKPRVIRSVNLPSSHHINLSYKSYLVCKVHSIENGKVNACSLFAILSSWVLRIFSTQIGERMPLKIVLQLGEPVTASQQQDVLTVSQINFLNRRSAITYVDYGVNYRFMFTVHMCHWIVSICDFTAIFYVLISDDVL